MVIHVEQTEELAAAWAEEMGDDSAETGACVADAMSDALDDDAWALLCLRQEMTKKVARHMSQKMN